MTTPTLPQDARPVLIPVGTYEAVLVDVQPFDRVFGRRMGLVFEVAAGDHAGTRLMESAAMSSRGKLAELVAGMGELRGLSEDGLRGLIGRRCRIMVRHSATKAGTPYASIAATMR